MGESNPTLTTAQLGMEQLVDRVSPSIVAMDRWVTTGSLIFSLLRAARVATLAFSFTGL